MELNYRSINKDVETQMLADRAAGRLSPYRFDDSMAVRRKDLPKDRANLLRPTFVRDIEKIIHLPLYNRYNDKTQVFSFYHNDDISRRGLHVQLVSRIARNIGSLLGLNTDLIEAIALGHDIGHTPFGHTGEHYLSDLLYNAHGKYFNHNVHSVRVLDFLYQRNLTLQTLDGIVCHNGEFELGEYHPLPLEGFEQYDRAIESCYTDKTAIDRLIPSTLEGCVVRISDMIAYIGKDRQDAITARIIDEDHPFSGEIIGTHNAEMINNLVTDIVNNSYGKDYIRLSDDVYSELKTAKRENYQHIYFNEKVQEMFEDTIKPMFSEMFAKLCDDVENERKDSIIYKHHIDQIAAATKHYQPETSYLSEPAPMIAADFIASMTDDYFIELYKLLFPDSRYHIEYRSYFDK